MMPVDCKDKITTTQSSQDKTSDSDTDCDMELDSTSKIKHRKTSVSYPTDLPSIKNTALENYKTDLEILQHDNEFFRMWASDLCRKTNGHPLPSDYKNYALSILNTYPVFGQSVLNKNVPQTEQTTSQSALNHRPLVMKLSACIRNRRNWLKKRSSKNTGSKKFSQQSAKVESYASSSKKDSLQPACTTKSKATISKDSDNLLKEFKKSTNIKDINHVNVTI